MSFQNPGCHLLSKDDGGNDGGVNGVDDGSDDEAASVEISPPVPLPQLPSMEEIPTLSVDDDIKAMMALPGDYHKFYALCEQCKTVFGRSALVTTLEGDKETHKWHSSFDSLKDSVERSCHFCSLVLSGLGQEGNLVAAEASLGAFSLIIEGTIILKMMAERSRAGEAFRAGSFLSITVSPESELSAHERGLPAFTLKLGVKNTFSAFDHWTPIDQAVYRDSTDSAEHIVLARSFISKCQANHPRYWSSCNWLRKFIPKRLLRLTGTGASLKVNLCITNEYDDIVDYCCLSHCWGKSQPLLLKKSNLHDFTRDIRVSDIPKLYLDAMQIVQSLGVDYLWIDSLCIIQDWNQDWYEQAAMMAKIYTNSYCTIAAADASDSHQGCYTSRNILEYTPCRITGTGKSDSLFAFCLTLPSCNLDDLQRRSPLFTRAWIFQERLLSPRVLFFSKWGIAFNCRCAFSSETDPHGQAYPLQPTGRKMYQLWEDGISDLEWLRCVELRDEYYIDNSDLHNTWFQLVGEYSPLKMTRPSDKLVALSGVAQVVADAQDYPMKYLAGLWQPILIWNMLWYVYDGHAPRPAEYRAPSWSWASVEGRVFHHDRVYHSGWHTRKNEMARFWEAEMSTNAADTRKMGRVTGSYLKLRGLIKLAPALKEEDGASQVYAKEEVILFGGDVRGEVYVDVVDEMKGVAYLLPLKRTPGQEDKGTAVAEPTCEIKGLFLHKLDEGYRRVGLFTVSGISFRYFDDCKEQDILFVEGDKKTKDGQLGIGQNVGSK